ncbi:MAG TPA: putative inorganic carbon transporter subunit DabA [Pilimelia sp.]|nr:putative inorganic carbon transporter subunit DabA [Pilimelia sp.]
MSDTAAQVTALVDAAARLLPTQAPLPAFVHHNTLHAFAHLPFDEAVAEAARTLGGEPYLSEEEFAALRAAGRIADEDVAAVTADAGDDPVVPGGPSRRDFLRLRLRHVIEVPEGAALHWLLEETAARTRVDPGVPPARLARLTHDAARALPGADPAAALPRLLARLWERLAAVAPPAAPSAPAEAPSDRRAPQAPPPLRPRPEPA